MVELKFRQNPCEGYEHSKVEESFFVWSRSKFGQVMINKFIMVEFKLNLHYVGMTEVKLYLLQRSRFWKISTNATGWKVEKRARKRTRTSRDVFFQVLLHLVARGRDGNVRLYIDVNSSIYELIKPSVPWHWPSWENVFLFVFYYSLFFLSIDFISFFNRSSKWITVKGIA